MDNSALLKSVAAKMGGQMTASDAPMTNVSQKANKVKPSIRPRRPMWRTAQTSRQAARPMP